MFGIQDQLLKAWRTPREGRARAARLMTPPAWLLVAAAVLALMAGWCSNAEAALALVSATGVAERPEHQGPLSTVAADLPRYMSVLLLIRAIPRFSRRCSSRPLSSAGSATTGAPCSPRSPW